MIRLVDNTDHHLAISVGRNGNNANIALNVSAQETTNQKAGLYPAEEISINDIQET